MRLLTLTLLLFINYSLQAQSNMAVSFADSIEQHQGQKGIMDANNNYVMIGKKYATLSTGAGDRPHMTKFDSNHVEQWSFYIDVKSVIASTLIELRNGDYLATYSTGAKAYVIRVSPAGNIVWYKGYTSLADLESSYEDANEDIYIAGGYLENQIVQKLDKNGQILWAKKLDAGTNYHFGRGMAESADGHILINGAATYVNNNIYNKITLSKLTKSGQMVWSKKYSCPTTSLMSNDCLISSQDSSIIMAGYSGILNNSNSFDALIFKVDEDGNYINHKKLGYTFYDKYDDIVEITEEGGGQARFALCGFSKPVAVCGGNAFFTIIDNNLDTVMNKFYGTPAGNGAFFTSLHYGSQTGLRAFGSGSLFASNNGGEYQCLQMDDNLNLPCNSYQQNIVIDTLQIIEENNISMLDYTPTVDTVIPTKITEVLTAYNSCSGQPLQVNDQWLEKQIVLYPNPAMDMVTVTANKPIQKLTLYSMEGKLIQSKLAASSLVQFELNDLLMGTYLVKLSFKNGQQVIKRLSVR